MTSAQPHPDSDRILQQAIRYWYSLLTLSHYQRLTLDNWRHIACGGIDPGSCLQLAPQSLRQTINLWSFSLFSFLDQTQGDSRQEHAILTQVAGYGSQLGTLIDAMMALLPHAEAGWPLSETQRAALAALQRLAERIEQVKT